MRAFLCCLTLTVSLAAQPLSPDGTCGTTRTCRSVIDSWNATTWADVVDETFHTGSTPLATVRWYQYEFPCRGFLCNDDLHQYQNYTSSVTAHRFPGVTDELGNVLLAHSMGGNQQRYQKLRNFTELLRRPAHGNLQCWKFFIDGQKNYTSAADLCIEDDSASDASLRILGAYGVACAKQRSGEWATTGFSNYCADYELQGEAIWAGEITRLANGDAYLATGYKNHLTAPTALVSFRPDYYELQFLMDYAQYKGDAAKQNDVIDMLGDYTVSMGTNHVHRGLNGHFDAATTAFTIDCPHKLEDPPDERCEPKPYMDKIDTWRAVPALSGLLATHPDLVPSSMKSSVFDYWWTNFGGGNPAYGPADAQPMEIYSNTADGTVKYTELSYKSLGMWIPLGAAYDAGYTEEAIHQLVDVKYDWTNGNFYGAAYYGAYFSQFAQRAIGIATGLIAPSSYVLDAPAQVTATANGTTSIGITWTPVANADLYDVARSADGETYTIVGSPAAPPFTDPTVSSGTAYLYRVRARRTSGMTSAYSSADLATTIVFTDSVLVPQVTAVRALHVTELRQAVNAIRALASLGSYSFTHTPPSLIHAVDITELRDAIDEARAELALPAPTYTDSALGASDIVKAAHMLDLRSAAQ